MTASATSSTDAIRPTGTALSIIAARSGTSSIALRTMGVSTHEGHTLFTRIPWAALSRAAGHVSHQTATHLANKLCYREIVCLIHLPAFFVIPSTACLAVVYWAIPGVATKAEADPMITMLPRVVPRSGNPRFTSLASCSFIKAETVRVTRKVPVTLTFNMRSNSEASASAIGLATLTPIFKTHNCQQCKNSSKYRVVRWKLTPAA